MSRINLPINQVKLTNVAIVRMNKGGKRFEIACYRNKVVNYRQGIETDLSEVLQTERVFTNVSKGEFAKSQELQKVFGTTKEDEVIQIILNKGDLQIGDLERTQQYESMAREIATWISENCIHPITQRPYTIPQIRQAMKAAEYTIHPTRSMKRQYLECFKKVQTVLSISRAPMELQITYPQTASQEIETFRQTHDLQIQNSNDIHNGYHVLTFLIEPSSYRAMEEFVKTIDHARLEILKQVVMREGDSNLEDEIKLSQQLHHHDSVNQNSLPKSLEGLSIEKAQILNTNPPSLDKSNSSSVEKEEEQQQYHSRQSQRQAQKKSKKALRREKEDTEERRSSCSTSSTDRRKMEDPDIVNNDGTDRHSPRVLASSRDESSQKSCNTCGGTFFTPGEYRAHFRSDWHRYNMKLKLNNVAPISEEEFLLCDSEAFFNS
jgi:ribosome maturation protein SDO1